MKRIFILALAFIGLASSATFADSPGLKAQVRFDLPLQTTNAGEAALWLLEPHGYRLLLSGTAPQEARVIARRKLPAALPLGRVMSIEDALLAITDQAVIIDTNNRLVSFEFYQGGAE